MAGRKPVVVGFDRSTRSREAAAWAAREASSRRLPLLLTHAVGWPFVAQAPIRVAADNRVREPLREILERELEQMVAACEEVYPGLEVRGELAFGDPVEVLRRLASDAELLVLGGPRVEDDLSFVGSTSAELLSHRSGVPVVVVRGGRVQPASSAPVVVGVDGSANSALAIGFAYDFASRHGAELVAVHGWSDLLPDPFVRVPDWDRVREDARTQAEELLAESVAGWAERYPDVSVRRVLTPDKPADALLEQAGQAGLLVVGSHGRGPVRRTLLGSVSHAVVNRSPCPVAVLRAPK
ncbi:nucleotide-binding universal stress UspA family protein [Saccharopolyspora erythraea NRRL 2338]|uniref:Universal stress protein family n=2 Tax=Saccharopolyspora erythraea TaxID=1836 RepID=A4FCI7_SACEN|nr:universal stress protein [Saccharopolyspora erythraea]EQD87428.1 universal stress protein [Saccharopolyspora erythraea D]PFG95526.1 nucleotide-binding universal stress UspA family protein [Saccharopolyspora erythraea NRRL 2338]QRK92150.1 universal stress protein [Saccharopolyspora erythraea]CAM01762.1 universal stress protein family [Saccharopolyspora erythraea NRRL 2338]